MEKEKIELQDEFNEEEDMTEGVETENEYED